MWLTVLGKEFRDLFPVRSKLKAHVAGISGVQTPFFDTLQRKENENLGSCPNGRRCLKMVNYLAEFCGADHPWQAQRGLQSHQQELKDATKIDPPEHRGCSLMHQLGEGEVFKTEGIM